MISKAVLYAICKNEEKNIQKWLKFHKYMDIIFLVDTGSTDNTLKLVKSYPNVFLKKLELELMDFSACKQFAFVSSSLLAQELFPNEECLFINLDIDEWLDELTFERMRKHWPEGNYDGIEVLRDTISSETTRDSQIRIHTSDSRWTWLHKVHENLGFSGVPNLLKSEYSFIHRPDMSKPRRYNELAYKWLKIYRENYPDDPELFRLLNTCMRAILLKEAEGIDEEDVISYAEERLLDE